MNTPDLLFDHAERLVHIANSSHLSLLFRGAHDGDKRRPNDCGVSAMRFAAQKMGSPTAARRTPQELTGITAVTRRPNFSYLFYRIPTHLLPPSLCALFSSPP